MRRGAREGRGADEVEACDVAGGEATGSLSAGGSGGVWLESAHGDSSTSIAMRGFVTTGATGQVLAERVEELDAGVELRRRTEQLARRRVA